MSRLTAKPFKFFDEPLRSRLAEVSLLMLHRQDAQNTIVHPEWRKQNFAFMRAAWTEAGEAMGYLSWEFWKNLSSSNYEEMFRTAQDKKDFHVELVDCLHFVISELLARELGSDEPEPFAFQIVASKLLGVFERGKHKHVQGHWVERFGDVPSDALPEGVTPQWTAVRTEELTRTCLEGNVNEAVHLLVELAEFTDLELKGLIGLYFAKAALNEHRWANGYKEGTYVKHWGVFGGKPREDNFFLIELATSRLDSYSLDEVVEAVLDGSWLSELKEDLSERYAQVLADQTS